MTQPTDPAGAVARQHPEGRHRLLRRHGLRRHQRRQPQCDLRVAARATGEMVWFFFGADKPEPWDSRVFTDVNGNIVRADATSWGPDPTCAGDCPGPRPGSMARSIPSSTRSWSPSATCAAAARRRTAPRARATTCSATRSSSLDAKTGAFKWHYQSIRHDVWDMDNTHSPVLADVNVGGQTRKVAFYGSKSGHIFSIDRTNGKPVTAVEIKPRPIDSRQPQPARRRRSRCSGASIPECLVWEKLDPNNIPGNPWRAVPNYNGYQTRRETANLIYTEPNYLDPDKPFVTIPPEYGAESSQGLHVRHALGPARAVDDQPERRHRLVRLLVPARVMNTLFIPVRRSTRWRTGAARAATASARSASTRPAGCSRWTRRPRR